MIQTGKAKKTVSANVALTSVVIVPPNSKRIGIMLYNNSANSGYVNFAATASSAACSVIIATFATWNWPFVDFCYTGQMSAIRNAGSGNFIVTEFEYE